MKKMSWISLGTSCTWYFEVEDERADGLAGWLINEDELAKMTEFKEKYLYLLDLLSKTSGKLHQVANDSADIFFFAANHGIEYKGANYEKELKEIDAFLKTVRGLEWDDEERRS